MKNKYISVNMKISFLPVFLNIYQYDSPPPPHCQDSRAATVYIDEDNHLILDNPKIPCDHVLRYYRDIGQGVKLGLIEIYLSALSDTHPLPDVNFYTIKVNQVKSNLHSHSQIYF